MIVDGSMGGCGLWLWFVPDPQQQRQPRCRRNAFKYRPSGRALLILGENSLFLLTRLVSCRFSTWMWLSRRNCSKRAGGAPKDHGVEVDRCIITSQQQQQHVERISSALYGLLLHASRSHVIGELEIKLLRESQCPFLSQLGLLKGVSTY